MGIRSGYVAFLPLVQLVQSVLPPLVCRLLSQRFPLLFGAITAILKLMYPLLIKDADSVQIRHIPIREFAYIPYSTS